VIHLKASHTKEISADVSGYNAARFTEAGIATHRRQTHLPDIDQAIKQHLAEDHRHPRNDIRRELGLIWN
jgi:hypothetical protein